MQGSQRTLASRGTASLIIAATQEDARELLDTELISRHLKPHSEEPYTLIEVDTNTPSVVVIRDGDY